MKAVTFPCSGSAAEARARLEAAIDGRPWNAPDWTAGSAATARRVLSRRKPSTGLFSGPPSSGASASATARQSWTAASG